MIDRVEILKAVSIFAGIPHDVLLEAASILQDVPVKAGQVIFQKGDYGTSMYIIASGKVRVHDGERTFNFLETSDVFGEMAALDPESRSATVTTVEDTLLLRLEQEGLYNLMLKRSSVARGIIHILCQRLRARTRDIAEDYRYMQQFMRVTAAAVAVEAGIYQPESLDEVAERTDELGQLARVFQRMVRQVHTRELRLKQEVEELLIEVDQARQARQVAEITETDYFQQLQTEAARLRETRRGRGQQRNQPTADASPSSLEEDPSGAP